MLYFITMVAVIKDCACGRCGGSVRQRVGSTRAATRRLARSSDALTGASSVLPASASSRRSGTRGRRSRGSIRRRGRGDVRGKGASARRVRDATSSGARGI